MHILITGGSGFIGSKLCEILIEKKYQVTVLTRDKIKTAQKFKNQVRVIDYLDLKNEYKNIFYSIIINLAGESLSNGAWTPQKKQALISSRLNTTQAIIDYIIQVKQKPTLLISGSAIGYYGHSAHQILTEETLPLEKDFAHDLCAQWEDKANEAKKQGVRVCLLRIGIVLEKQGGALSKMLLPFKLGLGGKMGGGKQWMSWVHLDDVIGIILHIMTHAHIHDAINVTAPSPVRNQEFTHTLGQVLHRPVILTLPAFLLKLLLGEMAESLLLTGQHVLPKKILAEGYVFQYKNLDKALRSIFIRK